MKTQKIDCATVFTFLFLFSQLIFAQTPPPAPTGLKVTATECGKISLAWDEYPVGVLNTVFEIQRYDNIYNSYRRISTVQSSISNFDDLGTNGAFYVGYNYKYRLSASNSSIGGVYSNEVTASISNCPKINDLNVSNSKCGAFTLSWAALPNAINYTIYRSLTGDENQFGFYETTTQNTYTDTGLHDHQINALNSGQIYYYKVKANLPNLITEFSNKVSSSFTCQAPTGLTVINASCGAIEMKWTDYPANILEDGFSIARASDPNGTFYKIGTVAKNTTSFVDKDYNFVEGLTYYYKVSGVFNYTEAQSPTVASGSFTCTIPTGLKVTNTDCGLINLAWDDYPAGTNETGYEIVRYEPNGSTYVLASVGANVLNYSITNNSYYSFSPNTTYYYKIAGKFNNKTTQFTAPVSASFTCPIPTNLRVVSSDCFTVNLAWDDLPAPYSEAGYIIYRTNNGYYSQIAEVGSNVLSYVDNTYKYSGVTYEYKIEAKINGAKTNPSNIVNAKIECLAPTDMEVTSATCGEISLKWKNNYTGPVLVFIYRSDNGENGNYSQIHYYVQNLNTYIDKGGLYNPLIEGKTYYYKVQVVKNGTTTEYSNVASGSFKCTAPINLTISDASCGQYTLSWPDYPAGTDETGYVVLRSTSQADDSFAFLTELPANTQTYIDKNLYHNYYQDYTYYYKITGKFNNTRTGLSNTVTSNYTCPIVQNLNIISTTCGQINLKWDFLPSQYTVNKYLIYRGSSISNGYFSKIGEIVGFANNYSDNYNLELGQTYYYKVKALINIIETDLSSEVSASFTCQAPQNLKVTASSCGQVSLSWDDYSGLNETGYRIYRYNTNYNYYNNYQEIANLPANTLTFTDFGNMEADKPQYYKIKGRFNDTFTDFSTETSGSFSCEMPGTLRAVSNKCGEIELSWDDFPLNFSENKFIIYRSDYGAAGPFTQIAFVAANTLNFTDKGLSSSLLPGKSYFYQIKGGYLNSVTAPSNTVESQTACLAPANFKISNTNCGSITLSWDDYPAGIDETNYIILRSSNGETGNYYQVAVLNANTTTYTDNATSSNELYVNRNYYYKIVGRFNLTNSTASEVVFGSFTCEVPQNLTVKSSICGAISLKWDDLSASNFETGYIIYRSTTSNSNYYTQVGTVNANVLQFHDFTGISQNTTYYYKIAAKIGGTISALGNEVSASFNCPTPTGLTITDTKCGEISIAWDNTILASGGYEIYRADETNIYNYYLVGTVPYNVYSFVDKGAIKSLSSGVKYYYRVKAKIFNTLTNYSNTVSSSFNCESPTNLKIVSSNCGQISLAWDDLPNLAETGYEIFRSDFGINSSYVSIGTVTANQTTFTDRGGYYNFFAGKVYFYKIKGKLNNNYTGFSNEASASFTCALPQNLSIKATTCGSISLQWDAYAGSSVAQIYRSEVGPNGPFNYMYETYNNNTYLDNGGQSNIYLNKTYYYKIKLKIGNLVTDFSNIASANFTCETPQNLIVTGTTCGEISLKWDDYPAGISENSFDIYRSMDNQNGDYALVGSTPANILTFTDRGQFGDRLLAGHTYYYKISGRFFYTVTPPSNIVSSSFQCDIPQNTKAEAISCGKIKISWDLIPNAVGYVVHRSQYEFGNYNSLFSVDGNISEFQDNIYNNLSDKYFYKISARYVLNGYSDLSNAAFAQTVCPVPQNLQIIEAKCGSVRLSWDDLPTQYQETGYAIYRIEKNGSDSQYYHVGSVAANVLSFTDTGNINRRFPANNTSFGYVIAASFGNYTSSQTEYSNEVFTKFDCQTTITGTVAETSCGKITLNWNTISSELITTYAITRSTSLLPENFQPIAYLDNQTINTYEDADFKEAGITYYYKIYGFIGSVSIESNNIVSASFTCGAAPALSIVSTECGKVSLAWTDYPASLTETNFEVSRSENGVDFYYVGRINPNTFTFDDIGTIRPLQSGINYQYRINGYNYLVKFDASNTVSTQLNCYTAPVLTLLNTECGKINLSWTDYNGIENEDSYILYRAVEGDDYYYPINPITSLNFTDKGALIANQKYNYKIAAKFGNSLSPFSNTITAAFSCENNMVLTATATSCNTVKLDWTADPNQGKNYFYYRIYRSENGLNGDYKEITGKYTNSLIDDYNIVAGNTYFYKIKTDFNSLLSDFSAPASVTVTCANYSKSPPENFKSIAQNCSQIDLKWDDFGAGITEESYEIHRSTDGINYTLIASLPANTTNYSDKNLLQNSQYYYLIRGRFTAGLSDYSSAVLAKTSCAAVANFTVSGQTCSSISLTWSDLGAVNTEESYEIHRSTDGVNYSFLTPIDANITTYIDKNLPLNTTFYYLIRGRFGAGFTPFTAAITGKTACAGPANFIATPQNCTQILLSWADLGPTNTEESYELYRSTTGLENTFEFIKKIDANATEYLDQSLATNQQYWYTIRGRFGTGFSPFSATASAKTVPITLLLKNKNAGSVTLNWNICSSDRENWAIFQSTDGKNLTEIKREDALIDFSKIDYLNTGQTYYFWVSPILKTGYGNLSNMITVKIPDFPAPSLLDTTAVTDSTISLKWQDNSNGPDHEESWSLMEQKNDSSWVEIKKIDANKIAYKLDSLQSDTTYCLAIRARWGMGFSTLSNHICIKTLPTIISTKKSLRLAVIPLPYEADFKPFIYPNPAQKILTINYENHLGPLIFNITNIYGKTLLAENLVRKNTLGKYTINIEQLTNGIYFLNLKNNEKSITLKFLKFE